MDECPECEHLWDDHDEDGCTRITCGCREVEPTLGDAIVDVLRQALPDVPVHRHRS